MAQSIAGTVDALYAACVSMYATTTSADGVAALVSLGLPGQYQPNLIVAVASDIREPIDRPTMGTTRSRDTKSEIDVLISVYVPGDESSQITALDTALAMRATLETYLRTGTNNTLGGVCRDIYVSNANTSLSVAYQQFDDPNAPPNPTGRVADTTLTLTANIRY